ncbi:MAG: calcium-binding protein [Oscillochloridaceae bacterium umkhey_bin13]
MRVLSIILALLILLAGSVFVGQAGVNTVVRSGAGTQVFAITPNDLKPPECAALNITRLRVMVDDDLNDTGQGTLLLGSNGNDRINGRNGSDCIVGGAGNDTIDGGNRDDILLGGLGNDILNGGGGDDILYGGPGDDTLDGGPGYDICYGGGGNNTFNRCEEIYP